MTYSDAARLADWLAAVERTLAENRALLNQADPVNGNHGDHMAEIFAAAAQAAAGTPDLPLSQAMQRAARALEGLAGNGSAEVYGRGLARLGEQFQRYNVSVNDLVGYVQQALGAPESAVADEAIPLPGRPGAGLGGAAIPLADALDAPPGDGAALSGGGALQTPSGEGRSPAPGDVLKALVNGLGAWAQSEPQPDGSASTPYKLSMGALFEFGMAYMQAKQRGGSKARVIADAAASVSPLSSVPHRYQSARLAIEAFLKAIEAA